MRAESPPPAGVTVANHWCGTDAVLMASVGCVMERLLECLVLCQGSALSTSLGWGFWTLDGGKR